MAMFPLQERKVFMPGGDAKGHLARGLGIACDYEAYYIPIYLPFDGQVYRYWTADGGNWIRLTRENGDKLEFAHLSKYLVLNGDYKQGTKIAITGNTGYNTSGPHLHIQIIKGQRIDPEKYNWEMTNAILITDGQTYFIAEPATSPDGLETLMKSHGLGDLPKTPQGQPDWNVINSLVKAHISYH